MGSRFDEKYAKEHFYKPGPMQYKINTGLSITKREAPGYGFGSSKRSDITGPYKRITPSPAAYTLPSKVGEVPSFVTKNFGL